MARKKSSTKSASSKTKSLRHYLSLPFRTAYLLLAVSLLVNVALASFVWYLQHNAGADFALANEGLTRACQTNYAQHMKEFTTDAQRAVFSESMCHRNYLTGAPLPFNSSDGKFRTN